MIKNRPGWSEIKAVKEGRIITEVDNDIMGRPGPRLAEGVEMLARVFYPELFAEP